MNPSPQHRGDDVDSKSKDLTFRLCPALTDQPSSLFHSRFPSQAARRRPAHSFRLFCAKIGRMMLPANPLNLFGFIPRSLLRRNESAIRNPPFPHVLSGGSTQLATSESESGPPIETPLLAAGFFIRRAVLLVLF